ncbi:N-Acetyl-D-glucosamine ABC transport system, sugar-binding protein [Lachnospiraceae bacterium TWA4]|nr:N-Acetyl-D-glucosamine ABC transport system, sugar-binding protein [Lachnospiraceae bacterium TWA4]
MKKNLTKVLALSLCAAMAFSMAACSSGGSNDGGNKETQAQGSADGKMESGVLQVSIWDKNQQPGLQKIMDKWTETSGVKVSIVVTPWDQYWTQLEAGATGGDLPDVFWMHSNNSNNYMSSGLLMDLTEEVTPNVDKYNDGILSLYTYDSKYYAVPKDIDTIALWYNKKMFDAAGVDYPNENWTWDDFAAAAKKLTNKDKGEYGFAMKTSNNQDNWYNVVYSMGGNIISEDMKKSGLDDENTLKAMNFLTDLLKEVAPEYSTVSENGPDALFQSGKLAMTMQGSWQVPAFMDDDNVKSFGDVAVLPKDATTGNRSSCVNGLGWSIDAKTEMPNAAKSLVTYLGTEEAQKMQADLGVTMSALKDTKLSTAWQDTYNKTFAGIGAYVDTLDNATLITRPHSVKTTSKWEDALSTDLVNAFSGTQDTTEACKAVAAKMNDMLASE